MALRDLGQTGRRSRLLVLGLLAPVALGSVVVVMAAILLDQRIVSFSLAPPASQAGSPALTLTIVAAILLLIAILVLVLAIRATNGAHGAALYLTAVGVPFTVAVYTIGAYIIQRPDSPNPPVNPYREVALPLGIVATLVTWLAVAWVLRRFATAERANESLFGELQGRLSRLEGWTSDWPTTDPTPPASSEPAESGTVAGWRSVVSKVAAAVVVATFVVATLVHAGARAVAAALGRPAVTRRPHIRGCRCRTCCGAAGWWSQGDEAAASEQAGRSGDAATTDVATDEGQSVDPQREAALKEAKAHADAVRDALGRPGDLKAGLAWVTGQGYIDCWRRIHRAEEALIAVAPPYELARWVNNDDLRLEGANIPTAASLKAKLRSAAKELDLQGWVSSEEEAAPAQSAAAPRSSPESVAGSAGVAAAIKKSAKANAELLALVSDIEASNAATRGAQEQERAKRDARAAVAEVRHTINDYRDELWAGMLRQRNHLLRMAMFTGVTAYVLVVLAIIVRVPPENLAAAAVFYLVGALAGLFAMINRDTPADTAVEDYGLSTARLIHARLLSGLAGVGGVVLAAFLSNVIVLATPGGAPSGSSRGSASASPSASQAVAATSPSPAPSGAANGNDQGTMRIDLHKTFHFPDNSFGLLVAAVFGLTPSLLVRRLDAQAKQWSADLSSTESTGAAATPATPAATPTS